MKQFLMTILFICVFAAAFSQHKTTVNKIFEKEIGAHFFVFYPDEKLPSVSFNIRKVISPKFQAGAGITEIYFRGIEAFYIPVYANFQTYFGVNNRFGANLNAGYGSLNNKLTAQYAWGPGNVIVENKGSYYFSLGVGYNFKIANKVIKSAVNYVLPTNRKSIYIESTKELKKNTETNQAISVSLAYTF